MEYKLVKKQEEIAELASNEIIDQITISFYSDEQTRYLNVLNDILSNALYELREEGYVKS